MSDDRSFERAARSWLEMGPTEAPERAIAAAFLEIDTTPQERDWHVPRGLARTNAFARTLIGVAAVAALLVGGAVLLSATTGPIGGVPIPSPSASPSAAGRFTLNGTFTSPLMGYSIRIADGWTVETATIGWDGYTDSNPPGADAITVTGTDSSIVIASQQLPTGTTYDMWLAQFHQDMIPAVPAGCDGGDPAKWKPVRIGPETGVLEPLCNAMIAFADVDGRIYRFAWRDDTSNDGTHITESEFEDLLKTVTFNASAAIDAVPLTEIFTSPWYHYSIGYGAGWTTTPASKHWVGYDNTEPFVDDLKPTGTDSTISIASQPLPAGTTFDAWVAAYHAKVTGDVPSGCDGGDPSTWPTTAIGPETGRYYQLCNAAEAIVDVGGRVYVFTLGNASIGNTPHFVIPHFLQMLATTTFDRGALSAPSPSASPVP
jgi:hypothetical protein